MKSTERWGKKQRVAALVNISIWTKWHAREMLDGEDFSLDYVKKIIEIVDKQEALNEFEFLN